MNLLTKGSEKQCKGQLKKSLEEHLEDIKKTPFNEDKYISLVSNFKNLEYKIKETESKIKLYNDLLLESKKQIISYENLIINKDGEVMIMDFGLAKAARNINYSSSSITLGTFAYAPPELFENEETTVQSDIYSLGVTMYKLLSGITGYENDTQISILNKKNKDYCDTVNQNSIDSNLFNIICKATRKSKNERYNNAREMQDELEKYINKYYIYHIIYAFF